MNLTIFPHFSRIFTASLFSWLENVVLWSLLFFLITINSYLRLDTPSPYASTIQSILQHPYSETPHIVLAQAFWQKRLLVHAKRELMLAQELHKPSISMGISQVLGSSVTPLELLYQWESEPDMLKNNYRYWQRVVTDKPDYRDAYLTLAALEFQMGNIGQAKEEARRGVELDPNLPFAHKLLETIEQSN